MAGVFIKDTHREEAHRKKRARPNKDRGRGWGSVASSQGTPIAHLKLEERGKEGFSPGAFGGRTSLQTP